MSLTNSLGWLIPKTVIEQKHRKSPGKNATLEIHDAGKNLHF